MEERVDRLTVLKKYMTMEDMLSYFGFKHRNSIYEREKQGLKPIILSERKRLYEDEDIIEFLEKKKH